MDTTESITESQEPRAKSQEPEQRAESLVPRAWSQSQRAKSQEPRAKSRVPRAESREPRARAKSHSREPEPEPGREPEPEPGRHKAEDAPRTTLRAVLCACKACNAAECCALLELAMPVPRLCVQVVAMLSQPSDATFRDRRGGEREMDTRMSTPCYLMHRAGWSDPVAS
eukprot:132133-Rhodomonas_salina.3